jgi:hypothetical protein
MVAPGAIVTVAGLNELSSMLMVEVCALAGAGPPAIPSDNAIAADAVNDTTAASLVVLHGLFDLSIHNLQ